MTLVNNEDSVAVDGDGLSIIPKQLSYLYYLFIFLLKIRDYTVVKRKKEDE